MERKREVKLTNTCVRQRLKRSVVRAFLNRQKEGPERELEEKREHGMGEKVEARSRSVS